MGDAADRPRPQHDTHAAAHPEREETHEAPGAVGADTSRDAFVAGIWPAPGAPGSGAGRASLAHPTARALQQAALLQMQQSHGNRYVARVMAQREAGTAPAGGTTAAPAAAGPAAATAAATLIVDDAAADIGPGQMRKTEFLTQLRSAVTAAAETALAGTGRSTRDCPYLDSWFAYYNAQTSQHVERAVHRYAPKTAGATTAQDYITRIVARVGRSVSTWARTGEITGVPEDLPADLPGVSLLGRIGATLSGIGAAAERLVQGAVSVLRKARDGGSAEPVDPRAVQAELGAGLSLDGDVRSRMETAFGHDFSGVRIHTDSTAGAVAAGLNARAFTVGEQVAFGSGEYQPGTPVGDVLIAHELAHVVQQGGPSASAALSPKGGTSEGALEVDADLAAVGAMMALWGRTQGDLSRLAQNAVPSLRSGLRLQRCSSTGTEPAPQATAAPPVATPAAPPAPAPPRPLFEQYETGTQRQGVIDDAVRRFGGNIDTSLMEEGRMFYYGAMPEGGGTTWPPRDRQLLRLRRRERLNAKPYVEIYAEAFRDGLPYLESTIWHEYQHVQQYTPRSGTIVGGVSASDRAAEVEAYSQEIIDAETRRVEFRYVEEFMWRRLQNHWRRLRAGPLKERLRPLYDRAVAAYRRIQQAAQRAAGQSP